MAELVPLSHFNGSEDWSGLLTAAKHSKLEMRSMVLAILYGVIFLSGTFENLKNICMLLRVFCACEKRKHLHIKLYILVLSVVDLIVLMGLPFIIAEIIQVRWTLGQFLCKMLWSSESLKNLLSTFILVATSGVCYFGVCRIGLYAAVSSLKLTVCVILVCTIVSVTLMTPVYMYADEFVLGQFQNDTFYAERIKCMFNPPAVVHTAFFMYILIIGFCLTSCLQIVFYALVLREIYVRGKREISRVRLWTVTRTVMLLVAFYLICWTPHWAFHVYLYFLDPVEHSQDFVGVLPVTAIYVIHMLPYFHAAGNGSLYLLVNQHLKSRHNSVISAAYRRYSQKLTRKGRPMPKAVRKAKCVRTMLEWTNDFLIPFVTVVPGEGSTSTDQQSVAAVDQAPREPMLGTIWEKDIAVINGSHHCAQNFQESSKRSSSFAGPAAVGLNINHSDNWKYVS